MCYEKQETNIYVLQNVARLNDWQLGVWSLKLMKQSYNIPFSENQTHYNLTNDWGCMWQCITKTRSVDSLG